MKRALSLSADLEAARSALRSERVAHAASSKSLTDAERAVASLGVGLASFAKSLSDERLARRSLHERLKTAGDVEARLSKMQAEGKLLREDAEGWGSRRRPFVPPSIHSLTHTPSQPFNTVRLNRLNRRRRRRRRRWY